jgi:hypothetical protein
LWVATQLALNSASAAVSDGNVICCNVLWESGALKALTMGRMEADKRKSITMEEEEERRRA